MAVMQRNTARNAFEGTRKEAMSAIEAAEKLGEDKVSDIEKQGSFHNKMEEIVTIIFNKR